MRFLLTFSLTALALGLVLVFWPGSGRGKESDSNLAMPPSPFEDPVTPLNKPDNFAWQLFAAVNRPAPAQQKLKSADREVTTNTALWETWASDDLTFQLPPSPPPDPANPPKWPGAGASRQFNLHPRALQRRTFSAKRATVPILHTGEEVYRNKAAFDFIIDSGLWYQEGLAAAFTNAQTAIANGTPAPPIKFPTDAIEIKANWIKITPDQKPKFHWNYDQNGDLYGLVAMHISSKVLPNWFWATFEWVDNPGRSDYIGSRDTFGVRYPPTNGPNGGDPTNPAIQAPYGDRLSTGKIYPPGTVTPDLLKLFKDVGFSEEWTAQWLNYRLKGSQTDFADSSGVPRLLGNSVTEFGFVPTASCITCHARAAINSKGGNPNVVGFNPVRAACDVDRLQRPRAG